jgi:hypothetical protein
MAEHEHVHEHEHEEEDENWEQQLAEMLPLYGHRNWIVVADAAYPAQSKPGIATAVIDCSQIDAVKTVRDLIAWLCRREGCEGHLELSPSANGRAGRFDEATATR